MQKPRSRTREDLERSRLQESEDPSLAAAHASAFVSAQPLSQNCYNYPVPMDHCSSTNGMGANESIVQMDQKLRHMETLVARLGSNQASDDPPDTPNLRLLKAQWRNVGVVMDRLFFVIYFIVIIITLSILFPWPKYPEDVVD